MLPPGPSISQTLLTLRWLRRPIQVLEEYSARYGDAFTLSMVRDSPFVVFTSPAAVKDIFTGDPDTLHAGEANILLKSVLGENSLLLLDGDRHLRERRLMLPPFHGERMRSYGALMRDATERAMARWPVGKPFPIHHETQAITLEVILRAVFGLEEESRLERMRRALVKWTTLGTSRAGTAILLTVPPQHAPRLRQIAHAEWKIGGLRVPVGRLAPWSPLTRAQDHVGELLREEIVERRRTGTAGREDILSMLLESRDEHGNPMTDDQLHDEMLTLLVAGHETTATGLAWTVHELLQHPDWMAKVKVELAAGNDALLDAAIKETLRLRPVVPLVGRKLTRPEKIGGTELPKGAVALASIYLAHRRAETWPDPLRFDPTRFLDKKIDPYVYFPFGGGTRRCLGMAFANYEMKVVLATILSKVTLKEAPGSKVKLVRRGITLAPSGGMPVVAYA
jgi:cytochrome P450